MLTKNRIYPCLLVLMTLLAPLSVLAYNKSWDQGHQTCVVEPGTNNWGKFDKSGVFHGGYTSKECCQKYCQVCPVYANTGQLKETFTDLSLKGIGPALEIKRTYNSQDWANSFLGKGWTFNFGKRLIVARRSDNEKIIGLVLETGEKNYYLENSDGSLQRLTGYGATFDLIKNTDGTYTIKELDGSRTDLKADGKIDKIIDRNNNQLTFDYNPVGCVSRITNATGNFIDFQLGPNGKIASATDNFGRTVGYEYDANGNLVSVTDPLGNTEQYAYNSDNLLTQRIDARGIAVESVSYDDYLPPRVRTFTEKGETFSVAYFADRTEKTDSQNHKWTYYYNDVGVIERTIDPLGDEVKQSFNMLTTTSADWKEDANGNRTSYTYDELGNITSKTDAAGSVWTYSYVAGSDRVETEANPLGVITKYSYDANGNKTNVVQDLGGPLESETIINYDNNGNLLNITDPLGSTISYEYDLKSNVVKVTDPLGNATTYAYDDRGNRTTITDVNGQIIRFSYDAMDRMISMTDPKGNISAFEYDANGNLISRTDAQGNKITRIYDAYNRMIQETNALGSITTYEYDSRDNIIKKTLPDGNANLYTYDILNRLIHMTNAEGEQTSYTYDATGNLLSVTDGNGNRSSFTYDSLNRKVVETHPDGAKKSYVYDAVGNATELTDANNNTISFDYDQLNRMISKTYPDNTSAQFTYDALGRVISGVDADSNITYSYDAKSQIVQTNQNGKRLSYSYDGVGNRTSMTTPEGEVITFDYDETNQLTSVILAGGIGVSYSYDSIYQVTRKDYSNGGYATFDYDAIGRPTQINHFRQDGITIYSQANTYDILSNVQTKNTGVESTGFTYDSVSRLLSVEQATQTKEIYTYDKIGNRLTSVDHADWNYNVRNQLLSYDSTSYTYDSNGNATSKTDASGVTNFTYDFDNRLIRVDLPDGSYAEYKYDVLGRRIEKNASGNVTKFIYDGDKLLSEYDGAGTLKRSYVQTTLDAGPLMSRDAAGNVYFYSNDHLGTPQLMTAIDGSIVWEAKYSSFGQATITTENIVNNMRFPGQYFDGETGLNYNFHRYYDSTIGRYITQDPLGLNGGMNIYLYADANPLKNIDPLGLLVQGSWLQSPRFNVTDFGVDDWSFVSPTFSIWGYVKFVRLFGHAYGYVNIDVKCTDECREWEVHNKINVNITGSFDVGPNLYALVAGFMAGPYVGISVNIVIAGAALLEAEYHYLSLAQEKAGPIISAALTHGPTVICLGTQ